MKEPFLESYLRDIRIKKIQGFLKQSDDVLDIGCGQQASFLRSISDRINSGVGIDFKAEEFKTDNLEVRRVSFSDELEFEDESFDKVFMSAVLEHLSDPERFLKEINRVLRPEGDLIMTVPSDLAKPVLEFLAYRLNLVSRAEIMDHKIYYNKRSLKRLSKETGFSMIYHEYFELLMNNLTVFKKN